MSKGPPFLTYTDGELNSEQMEGKYLHSRERYPRGFEKQAAPFGPRLAASKGIRDSKDISEKRNVQLGKWCRRWKLVA